MWGKVLIIILLGFNFVELNYEVVSLVEKKLPLVSSLSLFNAFSYLLILCGFMCLSITFFPFSFLNPFLTELINMIFFFKKISICIPKF